MKPLSEQQLPVITVDRLNRIVHGADGARVELPVLTFRLLDALAASSPAFVDADRLQQQLWPDTHITADALRQRVRLLRRALEEAGYDPGLVDSARGEGYALRACLGAPAVDAPAASGRSGALARSWVLVAVAAVAALIAAVILIPREGTTPSIGPSPVRLAIIAAGDDPATRSLLDALSGTAHLLLVPQEAETDGPACTPERAHLCLTIEESPSDGEAWLVTLTQTATGGIFMRSTMRMTASSDDPTHVALQIVQFATPGVLRWIGGRTGAGDQAFTRYREGVRHLVRCDPTARAEILAGLEAAVERSPNFLAGRALLALLRVETAIDQGDVATVQRLLDDLTVLTAAPNELALAHLAVANAARAVGDETLAREAQGRAERLQPILARWPGCGLPDGG